MRQMMSMEKINGIIIDGKVYEEIKGECTKHCPFWSDKLCQDILPYCTANKCYFRYSPELTERMNNPDLLNCK